MLAGEIEDLVQARDPRALLTIRKSLRLTPGDETHLLRSCDWLRRLGCFREGYRLLVPRESGKFEVLASPVRALWVARFLNLMGAGEFAFDVLRRVPLQSAEDYRIAGHIYLTNFDHALALHCFEAMGPVPMDLARASYASRIGYISHADALAGLGRFEEARELVRRVRRASPERYLRGIALQAEGEYLARESKFAAALACLERARHWYPADDRSPDQGVLRKWLGYALIACGQHAQGRAEMERALELLRRSDLRAEAWLDVLRLQLELGELPRAWSPRLVHFPGLAPGFRRQLPAPAAHRFGRADAPLEIRLDANERRVGTKWRYGNPVELKFLAFVKSCGSWGLGFERAKALLWPGEVFSYLYLENRLFKLAERVRENHGVDLRVRGREFRIAPADAGRVSCVRDPDPRPQFLREFETFMAADVERYYGVSKTQGKSYLKIWRDRGWIRRDRRGFSQPPAAAATSGAHHRWE
jgi:tetratricopeptide (TPR) repeat protein